MMFKDELLVILNPPRKRTREKYMFFRLFLKLWTQCHKSLVDLPHSKRESVTFRHPVFIQHVGSSGVGIACMFGKSPMAEDRCRGGAAWAHGSSLAAKDGGVPWGVLWKQRWKRYPPKNTSKLLGHPCSCFEHTDLADLGRIWPPCLLLTLRIGSNPLPLSRCLSTSRKLSLGWDATT